MMEFIEEMKKFIHLLIQLVGFVD